MYQPPHIERPRMMRATEVAERLDLPVKRVLLLARRGIIPRVKVGHQVRFNEAELEAWIAAGGKGFGDEGEEEEGE